ncbi:hypothetical protein ACFL5R_01850 [Pseudomonadota bacterium]
MAVIPTLEKHCEIYRETTPFPDDLAPLYRAIANLPWDEYLIVFKYTDYAPLDLVGKDLAAEQFELDDRSRRWAGKCARTIMEANGYRIALLQSGKSRTKRASNDLFGRVTCFEYCVSEERE